MFSTAPKVDYLINIRVLREQQTDIHIYIIT